MLHTVKTITKKINLSIHSYICSLLLSSERKNRKSMLWEMGIRKTDLHVFLDNGEWHKQLIKECNGLVPFFAVLIDGAYISEASIQCFIKAKCNFIGRFSRNRRVVINGKNMRIDEYFESKFKKNKKFCSATGYYKSLSCRFIACKWKGRNGKLEIIFFVTNISAGSVKDIIGRYSLRWGIEKFFRTGKQKLGLGQCQSRKIEKQTAHIFAVFLAHAIAEEIKIFKKKKSSDQILNLIRRQRMASWYSQNPLVQRTF